VYCQQCGTQLTESSRFCSRCGAPVDISTEVLQPSQSTPPAVIAAAAPQVSVAPVVIPPASSAPVLRGQVQMLAILWFIYSALRVMFWASGLPFRRGIFRMSMYTWPSGLDSAYSTMNGMGGMFLFSRILSLATGVVGLWAGIALIRRHAEGRAVAIVAACLAVISFPLGTALAIYTLMVLLRKGAAESYQKLSLT
jgi:hypothetical protein